MKVVADMQSRCSDNYKDSGEDDMNIFACTLWRNAPYRVP